MRSIRRYLNATDGVAAIEGALLFPLLSAIGFGIIDCSMLMMQNHKLTASLTSAGDYLSKSPNPYSAESKAKLLAVNGTFSEGAKPFIDNFQPNNISISYRNITNPETNGSRDFRGGDVINIAIFSASIPYDGIGFLKTITGGKLNISTSYETRLFGTTA